MDEAETLGGFIYSEMERVPSSGEGLILDGVLLTVEQVSGRRIRKVRARKIQKDDAAAHEAAREYETDAKDDQDEN
jgi:CBS domain containing-hemolysin-like protein